MLRREWECLDLTSDEVGEDETRYIGPERRLKMGCWRLKGEAY